MKTRCFPIVYIWLIFIVVPCDLQAQNDHEYILNLRSGGSVDFNVSSLHHYNNGIDLEAWTKLNVYYDTTGGPNENEWYLGVKVQDDVMYSNYPDQELSLDYVTISVEDGGGANAFGTDELTEGEITVTSSSYTLLVQEGDEGHYTLNINYHLDSITGEHPGYYNTNLIFHMDTVLPPW